MTTTILLLDCRCPMCNSPVIGKQEVIFIEDVTTRHRQVKKCQTCKTPVRFDPTNPDEMGCVSYVES